MLTKDIRTNIDNARQVLVGKIPNPQSQIEQITIAMIYKFMDDMDLESVELGGERQFFVNELEQYAWSKLMSKTLGAEARMNLYTEALDKLPLTESIPKLFRDIFKGAYLPFRDGQTLTLFLKEINEISYNNSENLGNGFEYLLSIMGSQGDAGQFRTPRHIIDFIVNIIKPSKTDTILDPACGTAGFLISAYKYILKDAKKNNQMLTPEEHINLTENIQGYDISPDMVKLALVNMYLHKFKDPKISEYDTLTSTDRWDNYFDVILANPPFMTPKGGMQPHNRFSVKANRSEVLFVDYIMEHLSSTGKAGIIIPDGILFKSNDKSFIKLRENLIKNKYLYAVINLPSGIFKPYSPQKTSILFLDHNIAKVQKEILFMDINNDGFDLGDNRLPIDKNDLPDAKNIIEAWQKSIKIPNKNVFYISRNKIENNKFTDLRISQYTKLDSNSINQNYIELESILDYIQPSKYIVKSTNYNSEYDIPVLTAGQTFILGYTNETTGIYNDLPTIIFDDFTTASRYIDFPFKVKSSAIKMLKPKNENINLKYVYYVMQNLKFDSSTHKRYWISEYSKLRIPLPSKKIQDNIVAQIEAEELAVKKCNQQIEQHKNNIKNKIRSIWGDSCE